MGNFDLHGLLSTIANNHGVKVPAGNASRKMRDAREGRIRYPEDDATVRGEDDATSAPTDSSMQLVQADTGSVTEPVAGESVVGPSGSTATGETAGGSGAAVGGLGLGGLGLGGLALGGLAGGSGGAAAGMGGSGSALVAVVNNIISGTVLAGPVLAGSGLKVEIYAANGTTKLGESTLDATGKFTVNVGSYTGIVIARLVDANGGDDYLDEATGLPKDLNANLMATSVVSGGMVTLNINPLTTIAAQKAGLAADGSGSLADAAKVTNANAAVAAAFGLTDLTGTTVVATNGGSYDSADGLSNGEKYGAILAALSGADLASGGNSQATIDQFVVALEGTGAAATLGDSGLTLLALGVNTAKAEVGDGLSGVVADLVTIDTVVPSAPTINAVASDNVINAGEQGDLITGMAEANARVVLTLGSGNTRSVTADGEGKWSYALVAADITAMGQGAEILGASATDAAGNTSAAGTRAIGIDTIAITPTIHAVATDNIVNAAEQGDLITGTAEANARVALALGSGNTRSVTADGDGNWSYTLVAADITAMGQGAETLGASATDAAGNTSAAGTRAITIDNALPSAPTISAVASDNIINAGEQGDLITGTAEANARVALTLGSGNTRSVTADGDGNWSYTLVAADITAMGQGAETLGASATDAAGNTSVAGTRAISIDTVALAPTIQTVASDNIINASEQTATISGGNEAGATVVLSVGGNARAATMSGTAWSYTLTGADLAAMGQGAETLSATQTDAVGNTSSVGTHAISVDTVAPVFSTATVSGRTLVMAYNEALDAASMPLPNAFKVGGIAQSAPVAGVVDSVAKTITLTLAAPVTFGQAITVSYTDPTVGNDIAAIQDVAGNDAASLTSLAVTNNTPDAPLYKGATVTGNTLVMTYEGDLDAVNLAPFGAFTVKVDGVAQAAPGNVAVNAIAGTVTLTLATAVSHGELVTVGYADPTSGNDTYAIQDSSGNDAGTVSNRVVANQTPDVTAPVFASAAVSGNGQYLMLTYDESLDAAHMPLAGAFSVKVDGLAQAAPGNIVVNAIAGTVTLTLATVVSHGETVTVSYTDPSVGNDTAAVQDSAGNDAPSVTDQAVTNNASDAPFFKGATVHGDTLVLTYNEALDAGNIPLPGAFAVKVGDAAAVAPDSVVVDSASKTVTLTLAAAVTSGQAVKVSYTDPTTGNDTNAIQDAAGNDADTLASQPVTNDTPPVFSGATVRGNTLVLTWSDALEADSGSIPLANAFTVKVNGAAQALPTAVAVDAGARTVTLTLAAAVANGQTVTVSYADPTAGNDIAAIQNEFGNDVLGLADQPVTNQTPPLYSSATVTGSTLVMTFSDPLDDSHMPPASAFSVKVNGTAQAQPTAVAVDAVAKTVTLTLAAAVTNGQTVTVSYTDPSTGNDAAAIQDMTGNDASSLVNRAVSNTTPDASAPVFSGATVSGSTLVLTYSEALDDSDTPVAGDFIVNVDGTPQAAPTAVVVDSVARTVALTLAAPVAYGETVTFTYTDPTAGNDVAALQDTAGNDAITLTDEAVTNITVNAAAPTIAVVVSAGADVNAILLTVTTGLNGAASVDLSFGGLPVGAVVRNLAAEVVTAGVAGFDGGDTFTIEFPEASDIHQNLLVTVTGKDAGGAAVGHNVQTIDLVFDVSTSTEDLNFASANQNMWGNFNGYIGWHEYVPFLGGAPIVWNTTTGEWDDAAAPDYWRSGEFSVIDIDLDSSQVVEAAARGASTVLDTAKAAFEVAAVAVDNVAKGIYDTAKAVFQTAENLYYFGARAVDAGVQATFQAAKAAYDWAEGIYDSASYVFHTVATGLHDAAWNVYASYDNWYHSLDGWGQFWNAAGHVANDVAWGAADFLYNGGYVLGVYIPGAVQVWDAAKFAFETTATGIYNTALGVYNAAAGAANAAAQVVFDSAKSVFEAAELVYNEVKQDIYDAAQGVYDLARDGVMVVLRTINDMVDFDSTLKVDSEVFAQVGLQVDFELDMGSVDTDVEFQLTSTTQYNKTADMLTITPTMTNMTTGDSVAFDTISPNAKFYAALLYDVGADFDVFVDGKLVVDDTTIYDLSPNSEGLNLQFPISTDSFASAVGVIAGGNIDVGKMVLLDLDTTKLEPLEVPFVEALTQGVLTIQVAVPTLETEGTAATYVPATADIWTTGTYEEQIGPFPYASIDFSEISSAFFNIIGARFDFSEEFMAAYGLDSLNGKTLAQTVQDVATGLMANIWDVLEGQSEGVPIFVLDMTDETSSSLLHLNLFTDDVMGNTTSASTGSLGFYAAYGESDPVVKVTVDLDAAYVAIVKAIAKAAATAVTAGAATTIHPVIDAIPNPYDLEFGVEQILKIASVPQAEIDQITQWVNLGFEFEAADLDVSQEVNFSQDFTLSIDDMAYLVTLEDNETFAFTANGAGAIQIPNAGDHDANHDGLVTYTLYIVPTAMFSNDTEVGLSLGYQLDFLKGGFSAGLKLPLNELLGLSDADWLSIDFSAIDISMGPLLRVQGEIDTLDVDVFESRFALDVGSASYAGAVDIGLVNHSVV